MKIRLAIIDFLHTATWTEKRHGEFNRRIFTAWFRKGTVGCV
jgi:hypothetical protein